MSGLKQDIWFEPSAGRMRVRFLLSGDEGAVQFLWNVPTKGRKEGYLEYVLKPEGWDVGFHALTAREWQDTTDERDCDVTHTGRCYYDGSSLRGEALGEKFMVEGVDVVWQELEQRYRGWLLGEDDDNHDPKQDA